MKYRIKLFAAALMAIVTIFSASASPARADHLQVGVVEGLVAKQDGTAANGASVEVLCNGFTLNTTTDSTGFYIVNYDPGQCQVGEPVLVTATLGGQSGDNVGVMSDAGMVGHLRLDVAIVHVPLVPEFGLLTGALTALTSGGLFLLKKRA